MKMADLKDRSTHHHHLLAVSPPEGLRPPELSRVALHLEVLVAFRSAKAEHLERD